MRIAWVEAAAAQAPGGRGLFADDRGASLLEYAIVLGMVSVGAIAALRLMGNGAAQTLTSVAGSISS